MSTLSSRLLMSLFSKLLFSPSIISCSFNSLISLFSCSFCCCSLSLSGLITSSWLPFVCSILLFKLSFISLLLIFSMSSFSSFIYSNSFISLLFSSYTWSWISFSSSSFNSFISVISFPYCSWTCSCSSSFKSLINSFSVYWLFSFIKFPTLFAKLFWFISKYSSLLMS